MQVGMLGSDTLQRDYLLHHMRANPASGAAMGVHLNLGLHAAEARNRFGAGPIANLRPVPESHPSFMIVNTPPPLLFFSSPLSNHKLCRAWLDTIKLRAVITHLIDIFWQTVHLPLHRGPVLLLHKFYFTAPTCISLVARSTAGRRQYKKVWDTHFRVYLAICALKVWVQMSMLAACQLCLALEQLNLRTRQLDK